MILFLCYNNIGDKMKLKIMTGRIIVLLSVILILTGCSEEKKEIKKEEPKTEIEKVEEKYTDQNNTKIGLYFEKGNRLELIKEYKTNIITGVDVGVFQIFPSNEDTVYLNNKFGSEFYNTWISLPNYKDLKIGFNVKYTLDTGEEVNYNILDYNVVYEELYDYLYDDYANRNNSWYSHIEEKDYNEDTLYTSIKLYAGSADSINSKISLTVFTYDDLEDFDENNNYRGNSSYTITICDINKTCN